MDLKGLNTVHMKFRETETVNAVIIIMNGGNNNNWFKLYDTSNSNWVVNQLGTPEQTMSPYTFKTYIIRYKVVFLYFLLYVDTISRSDILQALFRRVSVFVHFQR